MKARLVGLSLFVASACGGGASAGPAPSAPAPAVAQPAEPQPHTTVAFETPEEWLAGMQQALAADDRESVADLFAFPIRTTKYIFAYLDGTGKEPPDDGLDRATFLEHYELFITDEVKRVVATETLQDDPDADPDEYPVRESKAVRFEKHPDAVHWWVIRKQEDGVWRIIGASMVSD
jgi:hypothetical protein